MSYREIYVCLNRTMCDVLREMRALNEARNYSGLLGLIEEVQSMGNRMESKLADGTDIRQAQKVVKEAKKELNEIEAKISKLKKEK